MTAATGSCNLSGRPKRASEHKLCSVSDAWCYLNSAPSAAVAWCLIPGATLIELRPCGLKVKILGQLRAINYHD